MAIRTDWIKAGILKQIEQKTPSAVRNNEMPSFLVENVSWNGSFGNYIQRDNDAKHKNLMPADRTNHSTQWHFAFLAMI